MRGSSRILEGERCAAARVEPTLGRLLFGAEGGEVSTGGRLLAVMTKVPPDSVAPQPVLAAR